MLLVLAQSRALLHLSVSGLGTRKPLVCAVCAGGPSDPSPQRSRSGGGSCPRCPQSGRAGELGGGIVPGPQESPHDGDPGVCRAPRRPPRDSGSSGSHANACFQSCTAPGLAVTQQGCSFPCKWHFFSPVLHLSPLAPLFKRQGLQEVPTYLFYIAISSYAFLLCPCSLPSFAM